MGLPAQPAAHQVDAGNNVAPLVVAADLQGAAVALRQFHEIVGLQEHVAELGVGNARVVALQPAADGVALNHGIDRKVLAHVTKEADDVDPPRPVEIVRHDGAGVALEIQKRLDLPPNPFDPAADHRLVVQPPFIVPERRVADQSRGAAEQQDRAVPLDLEAPQREQRDQVADVQAVGGGIEAAIKRAHPPGEMAAQPAFVGRLRHQPAGFQVIKQHRMAKAEKKRGGNLAELGANSVEFSLFLVFSTPCQCR